MVYKVYLAEGFTSVMEDHDQEAQGKGKSLFDSHFHIPVYHRQQLGQLKWSRNQEAGAAAEARKGVGYWLVPHGLFSLLYCFPFFILFYFATIVLPPTLLTSTLAHPQSHEESTQSVSLLSHRIQDQKPRNKQPTVDWALPTNHSLRKYTIDSSYGNIFSNEALSSSVTIAFIKLIQHNTAHGYLHSNQKNSYTPIWEILVFSTEIDMETVS